MRTNKIVVAALLTLSLGAVAASAATWSNAALVDVSCSTRVKDDPDAHPRACALRCAGSGYGIWTAEGRYLRFDDEGSKKAKALLEASEREDHLRVNVTGEMVDGALRVDSIEMAPAG